mmetsp:Transcript_51489/g.92484  ORF Transcript_51489/g.92484 Transcript_51489/m.92484 type:complete len:92 (+) Transcript_51489:1328-1603(+)
MLSQQPMLTPQDSLQALHLVAAGVQAYPGHRGFQESKVLPENQELLVFLEEMAKMELLEHLEVQVWMVCQDLPDCLVVDRRHPQELEFKKS